MRQVSTFCNHKDHPLHISVEILGEQVTLLPKEVCHILVFGDRPAFLEILFYQDWVAAYPSRGCDIAVFKNGELIAGMMDGLPGAVPNWSAVAKAEYAAWLEETKS